MQISILKVGYLQTNCYILKNNDECLIIDPGDEKEKIISAIGNLKPIGIIITHYHFDHIGALDDIKDYYDIPVYDINNLEEKEYQISNFKFNVIYTKGHDDTCITLYFKDDSVMFTGDFLFKNSIGRTDFKNSDEEEMNKSIIKIKGYSGDITIYPGHGDITNLEYEKENNIFLR